MQYDPSINIIDLILRKRDGGALTEFEIATLVYGYTVGQYSRLPSFGIF